MDQCVDVRANAPWQLLDVVPALEYADDGQAASVDLHDLGGEPGVVGITQLQARQRVVRMRIESSRKEDGCEHASERQAW